MVMILLKSEVEHRQAAKVPARLIRTILLDSGIYEVNVDFLGKDLKPCLAKTLTSFVGFMQDKDTENRFGAIDFTNNEFYPAKICYFKDMGDETGYGPQEVDISLSTPHSRELVAA